MHDAGRAGKVRLKALLTFCALLCTLSALPFIARTEASSATDSSLIARHSSLSNHSSLFSRLGNDSDSFSKILSSRRRGRNDLVPAVAGQEINVKGNRTSIGNGDIAPDTADGTDFGSFPGNHTLTIENTGTSDLNLTFVPVSTGAFPNVGPVKLYGGSNNILRSFAPTITVVNSGPDVDASTNDYRRIQDALNSAASGDTIILNGTFDFSAANAAAAWALGNDNTAGTADDYEVLVPVGLSNVTLTANNLGDATIQGPGDLAAINLEAFLVFDSFDFPGAGQGWTISKLQIFDFDLSIGMFASGVTDYNNTTIQNNLIRIATDLNATVAPADVNQNIGIHLSFGTNQTVSGNTIQIQGNGVSAGANFSSEVGLQSNTSGGSVYDGLTISNNLIHVLNAQSANPEAILGIWENGHAHTSNITVSGNQFVNQDLGNNKATNLQRGFRVTSHSSATTTVTYSGNTVSGANIGFQWYTPSNFSSNQPIVVTGNTITNNETGVLVQSQGLATLNFNRIVGNTTGLSNVDGSVTAENNWWGCNDGPGGTGCDSVSGVVDFNPWVVLLVSASPTSTYPGGTSTITADMTRNSSGGNPAHGGAAILPLPDAILTATNGDMSSPPHPFTSGLSTSTFTSNSTSSGSACAQVDSEQECANITVTAAPTFSIDNVEHNEGNSGPTTYTFTVTKTGTTGLSASVNYATADDSATSPSDFTALTTTTLTFAPLETTKTFDVTVNGDMASEPTETFFVNLSSPTNATILNGQGVGTITNDDCLTTPTTVYVDDSWALVTPGTDPDGVGGATNFGCDAFATIQQGINAVASGGTVIVNAGNYPENVLVNKSVTLNGPKVGVDPNTGSRVVEADEAIVRPAVTSIEPATSGTVFRVGTNSGHIDVNIDGFTIDGHNPLLTGGRPLNGVEVHTGAGIITSTGSFDDETSGYDAKLSVTNNIIQNLERYGVYISGVNSGSQVLAGNDVSHNRIDNLPSGNTFGGGRGRGMAFGWDVYGSATFNKLTRVNVGWQDDNHFQASTGTPTVVSNNEIHAYHRGIFHNLQYQNASTATISNNNIFAETTGASATNFGIELASIESAVNVNVTNNNVTGNVFGILLWNLPTTADITVTGGTLTGNQYGVYATSNDPQFGNGAASHSIISGVTITNPVVAGIWIDDSATSSVTTALGIEGGTGVSGGPTGLLMSGTGARVLNNTLNNTSFSSQASNYISLSNSASASLEINGTGVSFDGVTGAAATLAQNYAIEDKIVHAIDDGTVGFVRVKSGHLFVTPNSFTGVTLTPNIQRGVNAATAGNTLNAAAGLYPNNVNVNKALNLEGANVGIAGAGVRGAESIIRTNGTQTAVVTVTGVSNVTINGFYLNGDDPAVAGGPLFSGDDANAGYAVRPTGAVTNLTMTNNIATKVAIGIRGDTIASQGNVVSNNWFDSIGNFDFGYCVSLRDNFYANVTNNKMTRAWTGVHINNHFGAGPASFTISGNEIHSYAGGILYWLQYNGATGATINNNQITAEAGAVPNNFGVLMVSIQNTVTPTFTNNTMTGNDYGVGLTNTSTSNVITLGSTNSISGSKLAGVYLTDNLTFNPIGGTDLTSNPYVGPANNIAVNLNGLTVSIASGSGVKVENSRTMAPDVTSTATITGATIGGAGSKGLEVVGPMATAGMTGSTITNLATGIALQNSAGTPLVVDAHFNRIIAATAINNPNNQAVNLENNWWGCNDGPGESGCGAVTGSNADFDPWVVLLVTAAPDSIIPGGTSTATVDMTKNSADAAHGGAATLPLPDAMLFATNGNMSDATKPFTAGMLTSTFTSTNGSTGGACAKVDNQPQCASITVTPPSFSIGDVSIAEGDAGTTNFVFTVTKTGATNLSSSVVYTTADNTAKVSDGDYVSASNTLTFGPADTMMQFTVQVTGDTRLEPNETFFVDLSSPVNATISGGRGIGTIQNDDSGPTFSIGNVTMAEGDGATTNFIFTVTKTGTTGERARVDFATANGTTNPALGGGACVGSVDYVSQTGTLQFTPAETTKTVTVAVCGDVKPELDDTFFVNLSNAVNASISSGQGVGTITNDDTCSAPSTVYVDGTWTSTTIGEDPDGGGPATFFGCDAFDTVQRGISGIAPLSTGVASGGTVIVAAGTYTENLNLDKQATLQGAQSGVAACGRSATESIVTAASGTLLTLQGGSASSIIDGFTFSGGARGIESAGGPLNNLQIRNNRIVAFTNNGIFLNDPGTNITVDQNSIDGGSKTGGGGLFHLDTDGFNGFHFTNNCITGKGASDTSTGFFVDGNHNVGPSVMRSPLIAGNSITNCDTGMNLGTRAFGSLSTAGAGTISNNTFANNNFDGLQGGMQNVLITGNTFNANGRHGLALTSFGNIGADRGAQNTQVISNTITGNGFTNAGAGISFSNSQAAGTIVTNQAHFNRIKGNATGVLYNGTESPINIENNWWGCNFGPGADGGLGSGCTGTPNGLGGTGAANLDGDPWIKLTTSASPNPTTPGGTSTVTADMTHNSASATLTPPPSVPPVGVTFSATNGDVPPGTGTITSGQANTTFTSTSTSAGTACSTVDGQEACTPINIQLPQFSISNVTQAETNSGTTAFVFDVTKTGATTFASSVQFQTADDSATIADGDYQSAAGTLNFGPTDTLKQITVLVNGDNNFEADDTFFVNLFNAVDATISDNQGVGTITNDDSQPTISIDDVTHNEQNVHGVANDPDLTNYTFTVTLSNTSFQTVTVDYATANNTASAPLDFTQLTTTTLTFNPGETSKQLTVVVNGDTTYELNETFFVNLTNPTNATTSDQGVGTINNDDAAPTLSIGNRTRPEGTTVGATTSYDFTVTKAGSTEVTATVNFATAPGTATGNVNPCPSGDDYQTQNGSLSFLANETTKTITVLVCKDAVFEADETFFVNLSGEVHATLADGQGLGTITNDDTPPPLSPVNTTNDLDDGNCDSAHCSLREAINAANASGSASIVFAIPAGDPGHFYYADDGVANQVTNDLAHVLTTIESNDANIVGIDPDWPHSWWSIRPTSPLPNVATAGVGIFIDGYTQTGASANTSAPGNDAVLRVEIDGSGIPAGVTHGLSVGSGTNTITGLIINRFIGDGNPGTGNGIGITSSDTIRGNFIGTDASGTLDLGNAGSGIASPSGFSSTIGGSVDADVNLISGNDADGITLSNSNTNLILGNLIGTRANGTSGLGNGGAGISLTGLGSGFNTIGGENPGEGNTIAFNVADGISLPTAGSGNSIRGNSIFSNGTTNLHLGIDLGADGVTANDAPANLDADAGPNNLQNFPVITLAQVTGSTRTITGTLNSTAGDAFTIDFYQSTACDSSGNGEGKTYLGSLTTDPTDSSGNVSFTFHPSILTVGQVVTATATSTGASFNTSEFSACSGVTDGSPGAGDIQFTDATYTVGEGGGTASITVTRVGGTNGSITATFSTSNGTAVAPDDYTAVSNFPITYVEGETGSKTITVNIVNDTTFETNETVNLSLSHPPQINIVKGDELAAAATLGPDPYSALLTINDNDAAPTFTIDDVTHNEGNAGTTSYTFTVTKTGSTALNATVNYETVDGPATAPSDFTAIGSTILTFLPADTTKQFTVLVNGDTTVENDEAFTAHLSNAINATISDADGTGTITNDDTDVSVAVSPASVFEDGATNLVYTFTRNGVTSGALTVNFSVGGDATFGTDYTQTGAATFGPTSGTVNFGAGNTTATVSVDPSADTTVEGDETAVLTVTSGSGYNIASPSAATGTISNDDTDVSVAVSPAAAPEDGSTNLVYTFTRTGIVSSALTVNFSVGGDATFGTDYTQTGAATFGASSGTVIFGAGNSTATVTVDPSADPTFELNETVILTLTSGTGYNVASPSASTGTISNDDSAPTFAVDDVTHNEGNAGTTSYTFTVTKTGSTALNATVDYATVAGTAIPPADFTAIGTTTLTFLPADTTKQFTVLVNGDTTVENDEAFTVHLSNAINATISDADGAGTITNDDTDVSVAVSPASVSEDGATNLVYTFTRNGVTSGALTVNFSVGGDATFGTDYTQTGAATFGPTSGTVNFGAGNTTATVTVDPTADTTVEGNETAILTVTTGAGYNVASPSAATGTITNDDTDVSVAVSPASVSEDGATNLVYTFTRNGVTSGALTVNFSVGGDATFGTDYTQTGAATFGPTSGTVNFGAGNTTATVTVDPTADTTVEGNETAILTVTTGAGYNVASPSAATGTITNDDTDVTLAVSPALVAEDGATNLVYTFTRNGVTSGALTVNFSVGGTATFGTDYTQTGAATFGNTSGTVNFGAGNTTATVTIDPTADTTTEGNETAILTVTTGAGYNVASPSQATGTITEDDTDVSVAVSPASVAEDGATNLVYTFTRNGVTSGALTVNFSVGGDATFGTDYTQTGAATFGPTSGTVNFGAGNTTATVTIDPTADTTAEGNETAILTVTSGTGYNVASPSQATGTINDDDIAGGTIRFSAANYNTTESSGSTTITVERTGDTSQVVTVDYAGPDDSAGTTVVPCSTISGLATPRCDFTTTLGTLRFEAGETSKTFTVLISQDNYVEGVETLELTLSNLTGGATLGTPSTATLTIADDASEPPASPIDDAQNFVRQHYHDFLNREPDPAGLAFWTNQILACGANVQCIEETRISVSASFFLSIEFQDTGYLVERLYKVSYGDALGNSTIGPPHTLPVPNVKFSEFMRDTQKISQGLVVLQPGWETVLENNKQAFVAEFVQRPRFATAYPTTLTPAALVDALFAHAGVTPSTTDRDDAINEFGAALNTAGLVARARVLRRVAEISTLKTNESNRAFVLMQYFGYLRRNPDAAQDTDHTGYEFWLTKLNQFNGNFINAEMVKAFISSIEYRQKFAP